MSHYISATINNKEIILTPGSSTKTIDAVFKSGFDVYGAFDSADLDSGNCGNGKSKVNKTTATQAYVHAIAWAMALEESFFDKYYEELDRIIKHDKQFKDYSFDEDLFENCDIFDLKLEKEECHSLMDEDEIAGAFMLLGGIMRFTYEIYTYTKNGGQVEIYFA